MASSVKAHTPADDPSESQEVALIQDRKLLEQFAEMAVMIPAEDGNGNESILRQILSASSWAELDKPWESSSIDDIIGLPLTITKVLRRPSTFAGGLGVFLVLFMQDKRSGKEYVKATGSLAVVGQVVRGYALGAMPMSVEWCKSKRPTEDGYYPQHLRLLDGVTRAPADAS